MTQLELARSGILSEEMRAVAHGEGVDAEQLRRWIADGRVALPANRNRAHRRPCGIGEPLRVKVNANLGMSPRNDSVAQELAKLAEAEALGADAVMDLSVAGELPALRRAILARADVIVGTVPTYDVIAERGGTVEAVTPGELVDAVAAHCAEGVDFVTLHCGLLRAALPLAERRVMGIVSRGGSFLARWMRVHGQENPLFERFDEVLELARAHDVTLSLGDGLRPGAVADANDAAQLHELEVIGGLVRRARAAGVQVIVEGPGHVPLHEIRRSVLQAREICDDAPLYVLGPLTTDVAPGYDHITAAIGGALAASCGAAFLCYVTPAEHLRLPSLADVREGVVAAKIAAHSADLARGNAAALARDRRFSELRRRFDWEGMFAAAIDGERPRRFREESTHGGAEECSMCGALCAMKTFDHLPAAGVEGAGGQGER